MRLSTEPPNNGGAAALGAPRSWNDSRLFPKPTETHEEAGLEINPSDLTLFHIMHRFDQDERISFFFTTSAWRGSPVNMEPHKCDDLRWISVNALPSNSVPYVQTAIARELDGILYSDFGWASSA